MRNSKAYRAVGTLVCLIFTAFFMFPLAIMLVRSFSKGGPSNYVKVFDKYNLWNNFSTSMLVVGLSLVIVALVVSFAASAFAKAGVQRQEAALLHAAGRHDGARRGDDLSAVSDREAAGAGQLPVFADSALRHGQLLLQSDDPEELLRRHPRRDDRGGVHRRRGGHPPRSGRPRWATRSSPCASTRPGAASGCLRPARSWPSA